MTATSPFKVDDVVIVHTSGLGKDRVEEARIDRVGRKVAYIEWGARVKAFDAFDGTERGDYSHSRIYTREQWADKQRRDQLIDRLRAHGLTFSIRLSFNPDDVSTDKLARLVAVLDDEDDR